MTREEFQPIFTEICDAYGDRLKYQPSVMATWYKVLNKWPADIVQTSAMEYMSGPSPYPPTPGQINSMAKQRAGTTTAEAVGGIDETDIPMHELFAHYRAYWEDGSYNPEAWDRIFNLFEKANRPSMLEYAHYKHEIITTDMNHETEKMSAL